MKPFMDKDFLLTTTREDIDKFLRITADMAREFGKEI